MMDINEIRKKLDYFFEIIDPGLDEEYEKFYSKDEFFENHATVKKKGEIIQYIFDFFLSLYSVINKKYDILDSDFLLCIVHNDIEDELQNLIEFMISDYNIIKDHFDEKMIKEHKFYILCSISVFFRIRKF